MALEVQPRPGAAVQPGPAVAQGQAKPGEKEEKWHFYILSQGQGCPKVVPQLKDRCVVVNENQF